MKKHNVITALEKARLSMLYAAKVMREEYGVDHQHANELCGAAGMIREWIADIRAESCPP